MKQFIAIFASVFALTTFAAEPTKKVETKPAVTAPVAKAAPTPVPAAPVAKKDEKKPEAKK